MEVHRLDSTHRQFQVGFGVENLFVRDFDTIGEQRTVDRLGRVRHEAAALEGGFGQEPGQRTAVVQMKVRDQQQIDGLHLDYVDEWQRVHAGQTRMNAAVQHDLLAFELQHDAASAHLLTGAQRRDVQLIVLRLHFANRSMLINELTSWTANRIVTSRFKTYNNKTACETYEKGKQSRQGMILKKKLAAKFLNSF